MNLKVKEKNEYNELLFKVFYEYSLNDLSLEELLKLRFLASIFGIKLVLIEDQ